MQSCNSSDAEQKFQVRRLEISDKSKGFIELLQELSVCDSISDKEYEARFQELCSYGDDHVICVIEDDHSGKIIATGSVFIEKKFLRNCGKVGHIEDVVVDSKARGMQLGKRIIDFLTEHAHSMGCYKVILDCSVQNRGFYEKCGFKQKEIQMVALACRWVWGLRCSGRAPTSFVYSESSTRVFKLKYTIERLCLSMGFEDMKRVARICYASHTARVLI